MDLSAITVRYKEERRGGAPYHPRMMLKVLLYGYCTGVASSRRIGQRPHEDIVFRVLAANNTPDGCPALAGIWLKFGPFVGFGGVASQRKAALQAC